jgi:hypothetical protein
MFRCLRRPVANGPTIGVSKQFGALVVPAVSRVEGIVMRETDDSNQRLVCVQYVGEKAERYEVRMSAQQATLLASLLSPISRH